MAELSTAESVISEGAKDLLQQLQTAGLKARWAIKQSEILYVYGEEPIATGSGGDIFKVKWRGIVCAVKSLQKYNVKSRTNIEALGKEIELMSTLRHPHLILFLGACFEVTPPLLLMEYAPGGTLEQYLKNKAEKHQHLNRKTKLRFIREIALGMNFLHKCTPPVIHRDFKPSNVLLDQDEVVKITDFALARFQKAKNIKMNDIVDDKVETGSYRYMAPELFKHEEYDEKVDIYSFSFVVYYILSGERPLADISEPLEAVEAATKKGVRPKIDNVKPSFARSLVEQAWTEKPDDRPSFQAILNQLDSLEQKHARKSCIIS